MAIALTLSLSACQNKSESELKILKKEVEMKIETAERNKAATLAFLKALENKDTDAIVNLFAEDGVQLNPYASGIFSEGAKGHSEIRAYWEPVFPNFEKMEFPVEEIYAMEDPSVTFVKFK